MKISRVKLTFPDEGSLLGGDLVSDAGSLLFAGETTVAISSPDNFVGSDFTLTCTVTTPKEPSSNNIRIYLNGNRKKQWDRTTTFEVGFGFYNSYAVG